MSGMEKEAWISRSDDSGIRKAGHMDRMQTEGRKPWTQRLPKVELGEAVRKLCEVLGRACILFCPPYLHRLHMTSSLTAGDDQST